MGRRSKAADPQRTHVVIVQDRSGSMGNRVEATIEGFNEYKNGVAKDAKGEVLLTLVQFDHEVINRHVARPIGKVDDLNEDSYVTRGSTSLNDAVMTAIEDVKDRVRKNDSVILVIMTDGGENSSVKYGGPDGNEKVRAELDHRRKAGWDVTFLGAGEASWAAGQRFGVAAAQSLTYGADSGSHLRGYTALASATISKTAAPLAAMAFDPGEKAKVEETVTTTTTNVTTKRRPRRKL